MHHLRLSLIAMVSVVFFSTSSMAQVTLTLDDTVIGPRSSLGIGVNGGGSWYNFVGAILVDDPSFEGPADSNGFARNGWPWFTGNGEISATIDTTDPVTGAQCQQITVATAPAHMSQGRTELPQAPLIMQARSTSTYRIRVQIKSDTSGARVRLGMVGENWQGDYGPEQTLGQGWQIIEYDYIPAQDHLLRGVSIQFLDQATYWLDDLVAWDTGDMDPDTGLSATFVDRLREMAPQSLRLGGLGVNGIPLESYLRDTWPLSYGPPALQPDLDLNTFLRLCRAVGALPFITVPPAFSDDSSWQQGALTTQVLSTVYQDHGNLVDYLGGDLSATYGARREEDGFTRWDLEFDTIYLELGNELWGTPDDDWDMDIRGDEELLEQMENFVTYNQTRMSEMRSRPGYRDNMRLGFCGRSPTTWIGDWPGSYNHTVVPALVGLTDFSTIDLYYGGGAASDSDEVIFGGLFASAQQHEREIGEMKQEFFQANGGQDLETTVYEGNATWGGYENDLSNPSPLYYKSVSLGAAVSLLDLYAAANRAGVTVNNHFHYGGNVWGATGPYPEVLRKPAFWALKLFTRETEGQMVTCTVQGSETWNDSITGEQNVPYIACYPYLSGDTYSILIINRHRSQARDIHLAENLAPISLVSLSGSDINANNELSEEVQLATQELSGQLQNGIDLSIPPFSAVVLKAGKSGQTQPDGSDGSDDGDGGIDDGDGGTENDGEDGAPDSGDTAAADEDPGTSDEDKISGSCGCDTPDTSSSWLGLVLLALGFWRARRSGLWAKHRAKLSKTEQN